MLRLVAAAVLALSVACGGADSKAGRTAEASTFEELGGIDGLRAIVDAWIGEATADPRIRDQFIEADIARLELHLVELVCVTVRGPCSYRGRDLDEVHRGLGLDDAALAAFVDDLERVLVERRTPPQARRVLLERMRSIAAQLAAGQGER